jgi:hypothetical protein
MSFADTIKGLIFKKKPDRRQSPQSSEAGPRSSGLENPYLSARRTWNEHVGSVVSSRQTWQVVGILSLLIALAGVGGVIHIGSQSKFIPYVVQVDKMGQTIAAGPVTAADKADPRIVHATVADFITSARMVTPDVALQRKAVFKVYFGHSAVAGYLASGLDRNHPRPPRGVEGPARTNARPCHRLYRRTHFADHGRATTQ